MENKKYMIMRDTHTSEENALIVANYPYGFKLRTNIRYWIETKGDKQRFCSQTLNPKTNLWNNAKKGTYSDLVLMILLDNGYIDNYSYHIYSKEDFDKMLMFIGDYRNDYINKLIKVNLAILETQKHIKYTIRENNLTEEESLKEDEKQKEIKKDINKLFVVNALKEGLTIKEIKELK